MKKCKMLLVALLSATLLLTPKHVHGDEVNAYEQWKYEAIVSPEIGQLLPAGPITITFMGLLDTDLDIAYYEVYFDDALYESIEDTDSEEYISTVYTTDVTSHTVEVVAVSIDDYKLYSNSRTFLVSKKGLGMDKEKYMDSMHLSWYYNWDKEPSLTVEEDIEYVPMLWSNYQGSSEWLKTASEEFHTVLGFNEPDLRDQANIPVQTAVNYQQNFTNSGLRIGAPVVAYDPSNNAWFSEYASKVNMDEIDFIPMHVYYDWGGESMADAFLKAVDDTYAKYQKPIWITEYGLANQWLYQSGNMNNLEQIKKYMRDTIAGLEERDYVERYAWFSFGMDNDVGGATALCNQDTGALTDLGELYKALGNPDIEDIDIKDVYTEQLGYYGKYNSVVNKAKEFKESTEYQMYSNREAFELALTDALSLEQDIMISEQERIDNTIITLEKAYEELLDIDKEKELIIQSRPQPQVEVELVTPNEERITPTGDYNKGEEILVLSILSLSIYTVVKRKFGSH